MRPVSEMTSAEACGIKYILMDIDDTLTSGGKLPAISYSALWKLYEAGLKVIPVTGRPAGWCDLIAREWPVHGVIGENGALAFWEEKDVSGTGLPVLETMFNPSAVRNDHPVLNRIKERAFAEFPQLRTAKDQFARLFDIALDFAEEEPVLPLSVAERVRLIAEEEGAQAKISSIHVNIWMGRYDKLSMAEQFILHRFCRNGDPVCNAKNEVDSREVIFVGDSPNDEPMFARFPLACAVANVKRYASLIANMPAFVASKECGEGFAEIAEILLSKRK